MLQFETVEDVVTALTEQGYVADTRLATTVFLVTRLDKPLLIEGPAGVGKTELAKALALVTGRRLLQVSRNSYRGAGAGPPAGGGRSGGAKVPSGPGW